MIASNSNDASNVPCRAVLEIKRESPDGVEGLNHASVVIQTFRIDLDTVSQKIITWRV